MCCMGIGLPTHCPGMAKSLATPLIKWPFYVWLDSLITTASTPSNPEYELCLPPFRVVRPGLIRLVLVLHGLSVSDSVSVLEDCYKL